MADLILRNARVTTLDPQRPSATAIARDSLGNGSVLKPGYVQRMSAGTGVRHSGFNHSSTEPMHFLQIWIIRERRDLAPSYEERAFPDDEKRGRLRLIASPRTVAGRTVRSCCSTWRRPE